MTRLLLIGAHGLDWPSFPGAPAPQLEAIRAGGVSGWLRSPTPPAGPAAWADMVTGRLPEHHGVWRETEAWTGGVRKLTRAAWRAPPLWDRLAVAGVSTGSVAWPALRPGTAWSGDHIDADFAQATGKVPADWALPLRCAPPELREDLRDLRVHPTEITGEMLLPLVADLDAIDQSRDAKLPGLAVAMAQAATVQAAATFLLTERRPEALFIYHSWLGEVLAGAAAEPADGPFGRVAQGAWRFFDGLVARLAELAGPEALVLVVSAGRVRRPGLFLATGPGVDASAAAPGAQATQVAATVLAAFGLEDSTLPPPIPGVVPPGDRKPAPGSPALQPVPADAGLLENAIAEGYAPAPPASVEWRAQGMTELAIGLLGRDPRGAVDAAAAALGWVPEYADALAVKAMGHVALEEAEPLPALAEALTRRLPHRGWGPLAQAAYHALLDDGGAVGPWLVRAEQDPDPEVQTRAAAIWFAAGRPAEAGRVFAGLLARDPGNATAEVGLAMAAAARRDFRAAEEALLRALKIDPGRAAAYLQLTNIYARTARRSEAMRAAETAMSLGAGRAQADAALQGRLAD